MTQKVVQIVQTGTANIASVMAALRRADCEPVLQSDPAVILDAQWVVLPGVGAFGAAMKSLHERGLVDICRRRILEQKPTLAICLGLQLLASRSEESPGIEGFEVVKADVTRFEAPLRCPQFGWSRVEAAPESAFFETGFAYFANSFCLREAPEGWDVAMSEYGGAYVAAMKKGAVLACQFHPELSGKWGHDLLCRWLECSVEFGEHNTTRNSTEERSL